MGGVVALLGGGMPGRPATRPHLEDRSPAPEANAHSREHGAHGVTSKTSSSKLRGRKPHNTHGQKRTEATKAIMPVAF